MSGDGSVHGPRKRRIAVNTLSNGISQFATVIASFVFLPLLVKAFGLSNYGLFMLAASVTGYAFLLDLGVGATLVRTVADKLARNERRAIPEVVTSAVALYCVIGVAAAAIVAGVGLVAGSLFAIDPVEAELLRTLLFIGAGLQLWYWPASTARHAIGGFERFDLLARTSVGMTVGNVVAIVVVLVTGQGPIVLTLLNAGVAVLASLANIVMARGLLAGSGGRARVSTSVIAETLRSGMPIFVVQIAQMLSRQQTDRLVLGIFIGAPAVSLYEIASKLNALITQASDLVVSAILPVAAGLSAKEDHASLRALFLRGAKYTVVLIAPVVAIMIVIARPFIGAWFGPGYEASVAVAQALMLGQLFVPMYLIGDPILVGKNRYALWVPWAIALALANLALSVVLVQVVGLVGVAIGTAVVTLLELPAYGRMVLREIHVPVGQWLRFSMWPAYPLLVVPVIVALAALRTPLASSLLGLFGVGVCSLAAYWVTIYAVGLSGAERIEVRALLGGMLRLGRDGGEPSE